MNIDELIHYLQYDKAHLAVVTKHKEDTTTPIFVFTPIDRLPDLGKRPAIFDELEWYNEERPVYIVVQDATAERLYNNFLIQWKITGFITIVNANTKGTKSAILNSLLHSTVDLSTCIFTELELDAGDYSADVSCILPLPLPDYVVAYSYSKPEDNSARGKRLQYSLPSGTVYIRIAELRKHMTYRTVLPFFESGFYVQLLYWLAEHGMDFMVICEPSKHNELCTHYDRIYADDLFKLRRTTPNLFTRGGAVDVHYIHELATETRALIY